MKVNYKQFVKDLESGKTEEDIKNVYAKIFKLKYDTSDKIDLYTSNVLFEFKYNKNFENLKTRSSILAQVFYYIRKIKYSGNDKVIPGTICIADKNEVILTETIKWIKYYDNDKYDWDLTPSIPDETLVYDISINDNWKNIHIFKIQDENDFQLVYDEISNYITGQLN